jgi:hypothetical protein
MQKNSSFQMRHKTRPAPKKMTALHLGVTARKGHIAHAVLKGKKFSQKKATKTVRLAITPVWPCLWATAVPWAAKLSVHSG